MKLGEIAKALGGTVSGDGDRFVDRLVHPSDAVAASDLALALTDETLAALAGSKAGAAIVRSAGSGLTFPVVVYPGDARVALAVLTPLFDRGPDFEPGVHASAVVARDAVIDSHAGLGPLTSVGARTSVGPRTVILGSCTIGAGVVIGSDCLIHPGVRIGDRVRVGDRTVIQPNTVIGSDGYSFIPVRNPDGTRNPIDRPARIHSLGSVVIGDDVEIGASCTIDRGTLRDTRIGNGTKIDNQVQIAHNVTIGECSIVCGQSGIAGSAEIGDRVIIGGAVGVSDHARIGDDATVMAGADVASDVAAGSVVQGSPAAPRKVTVERFMNIGRLRLLYPRVDALQKRIEALEKANEGG